MVSLLTKKKYEHWTPKPLVAKAMAAGSLEAGLHLANMFLQERDDRLGSVDQIDSHPFWVNVPKEPAKLLKTLATQ